MGSGFGGGEGGGSGGAGEVLPSRRERRRAWMRSREPPSSERQTRRSPRMRPTKERGMEPRAKAAVAVLDSIDERRFKI